MHLSLHALCGTCTLIHVCYLVPYVCSIDCYEKALQLISSVPLLEVASDLQRTLKAHFGGAWNELGTYYMLASSPLDYAQGKLFLYTAAQTSENSA